MSVTRPRRAHLSQLGTDESGFALVIFALTIVVLMIFVAFAVDIGGGLDERREDITGADAASLAGAQLLGQSTDAQLIAEVVSRVNDAVDENLTAGDFNTCAGNPPPSGYGLVAVSGANCIARTNALNRIWVRVPYRTFKVFSPVIGSAGVAHSAFAIAETQVEGFGNVLPFAFFGTPGQNCLKSGPEGPAGEPPCEGNDKGSFGGLIFGFFGNSTVGTPQNCTFNDNNNADGNNHSRFVANMAVGIDHQLSIYTGVEIVDLLKGNKCSLGTSPNAAHIDDGNSPPNVGEGMFAGTDFTDGGNARLSRILSGRPSYMGTTSISGHTIDDSGLWEFIPSSLDSSSLVPESCHRDQFTPDGNPNLANVDSASSVNPDPVRTYLAPFSDEVRVRKLLERCFAHYQGQRWNDRGGLTYVVDPLVDNDPFFALGEPREGCSNVTTNPAGNVFAPCTIPVFTNDTTTESPNNLMDIQLTPRFGYVPQLLAGENLLTDPDPVHFARFRAVYVYRVCVGNNTCDAQHEPGFGTSIPDGPGNDDQNANNLTAFVFPDNMLPNRLADAAAPFDIGVNRFVYLIR